MSIDLTGLRFRTAEPQPFRLGGVQRGALGGAQTISRLGDRWMIQVETPPMPIEPDGRRWAVLLDQAVREGALLRVRQPGFANAAIGTPVVASATTSGRSVPVAGLVRDTVVLAGQWVSIVVGGRRYLDKVRAQAVAASDGTCALLLVNLLRVALPVGAAIELAAPKIEGSIDGDVGGGWESNRLTSFNFTVTEDA